MNSILEILKEAAMVMGVLVAGYLLMVGLFIVLFRLFFPVTREDDRKMIRKIRHARKREGRHRKIKLANG